MTNSAWWNIFGVLKENDKSPYSRTLRTDYWGKLIDTFRVLAGPIDIADDAKNGGVFDYSTLYIFFAVLQLFHWTHKHVDSDDLLYYFITIPCLIICFVGIIARISFAAALTAVLAVPVFFISRFTDTNRLWHGGKLKNNVLDIQGIDNSTASVGMTYSLGEFLRTHHLGLDDLTLSRADPTVFRKTYNVATSIVSTTVSLFSGRKVAKARPEPTTTLALTYIHPVRQSCMPTFSLSWQTLLCFWWCAPNQVIARSAEYGYSKSKELLQGEDKDEFLIGVYPQDEEQAEQLSALFLLNVGDVLNNRNILIDRKESHEEACDDKENAEPEFTLTFS